MNYPLISICIPTYNGARFIREAMDSAIAQTYRPLEIIISDDDSKDETSEIIKTYIDKTDIPIQIYHHNPAGIGANWNNCVKNSKGDYIKFLFQDDLLEPECVEKLMDVAIRDHEIGLVFCKRKILYDQENNQHLEWTSKFSDLHKHWTNLLPLQSGKALLKDAKLLLSPINKVGEPVTVILHKKVFSTIGYFNKTLKQDLDSEFWYRVFSKYKVAFVDEYLATFRLHSEQATSINRIYRQSDYEQYSNLIYKHCYKHLHPEVKRKLYYKYHVIEISKRNIRLKVDILISKSKVIIKKMMIKSK